MQLKQRLFGDSVCFDLLIQHTIELPVENKRVLID